MERNPAGNDFDFRADLARLARFGANITDAHSCLIFIPTTCLSLVEGSPVKDDLLELVAHHSLANDVITGYRLTGDSGLIGWVSRHKRSIHVSPFEHDSRTLGIYAEHQDLKSFIGIPLRFDFVDDKLSAGVVACDSKKTYAFSKLQGKLLEELAAEISNNVKLRLFNERGVMRGAPELGWSTFVRKGLQLEEALGATSIEILRVRISNFAELEATYGTQEAGKMVEQLFRLVQQALPPHFPIIKLVTSDMVIVLDNMMTSYFENKIQAMVAHISSGKKRIKLTYARASSKDPKRGAKLEDLVALSGQPAGVPANELRNAI